MKRGSVLVIVLMVIAVIMLSIISWWMLNRNNQTKAPHSQTNQSQDTQ